MTKIHVLSVDDDRVNQMVIDRALKKGHFHVSAALTSEDALEMLQELHSSSGFKDFPHIILMDLNMPGISGIEATQVLRQKWPDCPSRIIVITGDSSQSTIDSCVAAGCSGYIVKPVRAAVLVETINRTLGIAG